MNLSFTITYSPFLFTPIALLPNNVHGVVVQIIKYLSSSTNLNLTYIELTLSL